MYMSRKLSSSSVQKSCTHKKVPHFRLSTQTKDKFSPLSFGWHIVYPQWQNKFSKLWPSIDKFVGFSSNFQLKIKKIWVLFRFSSTLCMYFEYFYESTEYFIKNVLKISTEYIQIFKMSTKYVTFYWVLLVHVLTLRVPAQLAQIFEPSTSQSAWVTALPLAQTQVLATHVLAELKV